MSYIVLGQQAGQNEPCDTSIVSRIAKKMKMKLLQFENVGETIYKWYKK